MKPITIALLLLLSACAFERQADDETCENCKLYECAIERSHCSTGYCQLFSGDRIDVCTPAAVEWPYDGIGSNACEGIPREDKCRPLGCDFVDDQCEPATRP